MSEYSEDLAGYEAAVALELHAPYELKLYISGTSTRSARAVANVRALCDRHLSGRCNLEVIDVFQQPELAHEQQLLAAPTLVKEKPEPVRRLVGDMSDEPRLLRGLNLIQML